MTPTRTAPLRARRAAPALVLALACVLLAALTACTGAAERRPTVVVTTNILGDIAQQVIGDQADVQVLMKPNADPHSFGISAPQAAQIENADLVIYNGLGLEENVLRHVQAAKESGVPTLSVGAAVDPITYRANDMEDQQDPHFWTDPHRVRKAVDLIGTKVEKEVTGVDTGAVRAQTAAYGRKIDALSTWMHQQFDKVPERRRNLVTNHHVFGYLAQRFDLNVIGAVIPSGTTLASPSAADLDSLATAIDQAHVKAIFADSSQPERLARVLQKETELDVAVVPLFSESLTPKGKGAATYIEMMRSNTTAICTNLLRT